MSATITLSELPRTSPTLWSHMRLCGLRAALAATPQTHRWVLHDPRTWLGTAFHRVMEAMRTGGTPEDAEAVWNTAIAQATAAASRHPLDARFAAPERWPSYFLLRQRCLALAAESAHLQKHRTHGDKPSPASSGAMRGPERRLEARGRRLVGRPDHFDGQTLTEYKSTLPDLAWPVAAELLEGFRRQVRLYAAIIADVAGTWPARGRIVAASGEVLEIEIDPTVCNAEADAALAALDALNAMLASGAAAESLATPLPSSCSPCPFQIICPAFWQRLGEDGPQGLVDVALEGVLERLEAGPDCDLYTVHILIRSARNQLNSDQPVVLRRSAHGELAPSAVGSPVRIVGGKIRPDGRLQADLSTIAYSIPDLPALKNAAGQRAPCDLLAMEPFKLV